MSDSVIVCVKKLRICWQDINEKLAITDPSAKKPGSMLISNVLHFLTREKFIRFNNIWDAMPVEQQTIRQLSELHSFRSTPCATSDRV